MATKARSSGGRWRWRRRWAWLAGAGLAAAIAAEVVLRVGYGLGDPPLLDRDPAIEYLYKPSRTYHYLHHTVSINSHSMRSDEFPAKKADARELRVMVIGDSIVTGGGRIDQGELATERLRTALAAELRRPVVVGNIACGSWGPPNQNAYAKRFGFFDADVVIVVLNSGDVDDVPGLESLGAAWPRSTPVLALWEPVRRAVERGAPGLAERLGLLERGSAPGYDERVKVSADALQELVEMARAQGAAVGVMQYLKLSELKAGPEKTHEAMRETAERAGAKVWSTGAGERRFEQDSRLFLPGDDVHPSAAGQARLGEMLDACVRELLESAAPGRSEKDPREGG